VTLSLCANCGDALGLTMPGLLLDEPHTPVRCTAGALRSCKSAILPMCHMLFLEGVYTTTPWGKSRFHRTNAPNQQELTELERLCRYITRPAVSEKRLSVTPAKRGKGRSHAEGEEKTPEHHRQICYLLRGRHLLWTGLHSSGFSHSLSLRTTATELNRLPGGLLPELSRKARKAVEEGVFSRKSRVLNRLRSDRQKIPVYPALSFLPRYVGVLRVSFLSLAK
jgi:hypothetical protein